MSDPWAQFPDAPKSSAPPPGVIAAAGGSDPWAQFPDAPGPQTVGGGPGQPYEVTRGPNGYEITVHGGTAPTTAGGTLKALGSGALSGFAALGDLNPFSPQGQSSALKTGAGIANFAGRKLGLETQQQADQGAAAADRFRIGAFGPTGQEAQQEAGLVHTPQNTTERYANAIGSMVPNALMGPEGAVARGASVIIPALLGQGAQDIAKASGAGPIGQTVANMAGTVVGSGVAGTANALSAIPRAPGEMAEKVAAFDRAGVRPSLAAVGGQGASTLAKVAAENPIAGIRPRGALTGSIEDTANAADRIARQYGEAGSRQGVGQSVQGALGDFANSREVAPTGPTAPAKASSFAAKAGAVYDRAFSHIPNVPVEAPSTAGALRDITTRIHAPTLNALLTNPIVKNVSTALEQDAGQVSFTDLRAMRSWVRSAQADPVLRQSIGAADLQRLESSLTQDIYTNAEKVTGRAFVARQLRQADQFYAKGQQRLNGMLGALFKAKTGESAYDQIVNAAGSTASADIQKVLAAKRSVPADLWGDVAATVISRMGRVGPGAANALEPGAFSINSFVTNYAKLSPQGRELLFGSRGGGGAKAAALKSALDNLADVASMQKGVEAAANHSKSAVGVQTLGTVVGLANPHTFAPTASGIGALALTGEAMTNPAFVRWLSGAAKLTPGSAAQTAYAAKLARLAKADPALNSISAQYSRALLAGSVAGSTAMSAGSPVAAKEQGSQP